MMNEKIKSIKENISIKNYINAIKNSLLNISIILFIFGIIFNNPYSFLFSITLLIISNVLLSLQDIKNHIIFLSFNGTLTLFLLSRFIVTGIFGADFEYNGLFELSFNNEITTNIIKFLNISYISLTLAYLFCYFCSDKSCQNESLIIKKIIGLFRRDVNKVTKTKKRNFSFNKEKLIIYIRNISFIIFIITLIIQIFSNKNQIDLVRQIGYRESFLIDKTAVSKIDRILDIFGRMYFTSFIIFISTLPNIKLSLFASLIFLIPNAMRVPVGARNEFILDAMILLVYFIFRIKDKRIVNRIVKVVAIMIPVLLLTLIIVEFSRGTEKTVSNGIYNKILKFFYNQGVSARVVGNVQIFENEIPNKIYSFGEITDFIKYSVFGKVIPSLVEPQGQSYEVFLGKSQLSHALTFVQSPYEYLNRGLGTGSSYIAELYIDFGIIGISIGSAFYGYLINKLRKIFYGNRVYLRAIMLIVTRNLFFTPRSSFTFFVNRLLQEAQIIIFVFIYILAFLALYIYNKKKGDIIEK